MKIFPLILIPVTLIAGWATVTYSMKAPPLAVPAREPVPHAVYDVTAIERNIAFHQARVVRDPAGAIGWSMLGEAWLDRARESDLDSAAWEAETAARRSLKLRERGNGRAFQCLIDSLMEQHRFHDALSTMDAYKVRSRQTLDALIESGRYEEAKALALKLRTNEPNPSLMASEARLVSAQGQHEVALKTLRDARSLLETNAAVSNRTLAWFDVKIGDEHYALDQLTEAQANYEVALQKYPRSYKANLALARLHADAKNWRAVDMYAKATQEIVDSLDARAFIGDAAKASGRLADAKAAYEGCRQMYLAEVAKFGQLAKGGPLKVRPIDRQFATFARTHRMFLGEAIVAATRDLANRPDPHARENIQGLRKLVG